MVIFDSLIECVGYTPVIRLARYAPDFRIFMKLERMNPGGSIKDRIAVQMVKDAEQKGLIRPNRSIIIEPTSGNTGIGLAWVGAVKGYRVKIVMPENMSTERIKNIKAYGAEVILTPSSAGVAGAITKAQELRAEDPKHVFIPSQFSNESNVRVHVKRTAKEIVYDFPPDSNPLQVIVMGVGTGGHCTGIGKRLREDYGEKCLVYAVEPSESPFLSKQQAGLHGIPGIGVGFHPLNFERGIVHDILVCSTDNARKATLRLARMEGVLAGISTGACLHAILKRLQDLAAHDPSVREWNVLVINYDAGERYLSLPGLFINDGSV